MAAPLEGVVALVVCSDSNYTAKPAIQRALTALGAKVAARLGREVTHVVYERRRAAAAAAAAPRGSRATAAASREADAELLDLYTKVDKLDPRPTIVSPSWVEESRTAGRRLVEKKYVMPRPRETLLLAKPAGRTPGSGAGQGKKRKQAAVVPPKPKSAEAFELGDIFTSSQQIRGDGPADAGHEVSSPRPRPGQHDKKRTKHGGGGGSPVVLQSSDTQQVADIMAGLLGGGGGGHADTPGHGAAGEDGWEEEGDDLDTPLSLRLAKSASRSASKDAERRHSGQPAGRSRLAHASGPHAAGEAAPGPSPLGDSADGQMGAAEEAQPQADSKEAAARGGSGGLQPAQRYSVRQLTRMEEKPLQLHKGTPLPGVLPPPSDCKRPKSAIPIPGVERVPSPWQEAELLASQSPSQSQPPTGAGEAPQSNVAQQVQGSHRRRSLLQLALHSPASNFKPPGPAAGDMTPWSTIRPWDRRSQLKQQQQQQQQPIAAAAPQEEVEVAAVDMGPQQAAAAAEREQPGAGQRGVLRENVGAAGNERPAQPQLRAVKQQRVVDSAGSGGQDAGKKQHKRRRRERGSGASVEGAAEDPMGGEAEAVGAAELEGLGPLHGVIAVTSVDSGVADLVRAATRRLRGLRVCAEGREDCTITHLVIGKERRTLKLMLAVANGAWLVSPEWVTASLEAGRWLPESQYLAKVRFVGAAERARCRLEVPDEPGLLAEHSIYFHVSGGSGGNAPAPGTNVAALKRVAQALGAKVVPPKACTLCIVMGGGGRPSHVPKHATALKEEWLLMAAERFEVPSTTSKHFLLR